MSPAEVLVGYKPDGGLHFVSRDADRARPFSWPWAGTPSRPLWTASWRCSPNAATYPRSWSGRNGTFAYQSVLKENEVAREPFVLPATGRDWSLPTAQPGALRARTGHRRRREAEPASSSRSPGQPT